MKFDQDRETVRFIIYRSGQDLVTTFVVHDNKVQYRQVI